MKFRLTGLLLSVLFTGATFAADLPAALDAALSRVEERRAAAEELRFTFTMHLASEERDVRLRYDPASEEIWSLDGPADEDGERMRDRLAERAAESGRESDRELLADDLRKLIGGDVVLDRSEGDERVYRFPIAEDAAILGGGGREFDAAKHLTGEIAIETATQRLRWVRFFAEESFKPVLVARIKHFDLRLFFDEIWENGPYVTVRQRMEIDGSAFFRAFAEKVTTTYAGFERR